MAKPAKRGTTLTLTLPDGKAKGIEELDLSEIEAQLPDRSASVQLYRQDPEEPTKYAYVGKMAASEFSLEAVKEEYGGGDYRANLLDADGKFTGKRFPFSIDRHAVPRSERGAADPGLGGALAQELAEHRQLQKDMLIALLTKGQTPAAGDPIEVGLKIAEMMTRQPAGGAGMSEMLKIFREGMAIGADRPAPATDSMGAMVHAAAPLFSALATRVAQDNQQRTLAPVAPVAALPPASPTPMAPSTLPAGPYAWLEHVRPYVPQLVLMAQTGRDPVVLVDFVLDQLPEPFVDDMELAARGDPRFVEEVLSRIPEARMQADWFTRFLTELRKALLEDPATATNGQH